MIPQMNWRPPKFIVLLLHRALAFYRETSQVTTVLKNHESS